MTPARRSTSGDLPDRKTTPNPTAAEFFAGIGLVRVALAHAGIDVVWANDIEPVKAELYGANLGNGHLVVDDIRNVSGVDVPTVDLATASFPCTDLSLAGDRKGLAGTESGMFWEFARVLEEMGDRRPVVVLLENVPGLATSHGGRDLAAAIQRLNALGFTCDLLALNAKRWVPQSRERLFIVGTAKRLFDVPSDKPDDVRPSWLASFINAHQDLDLQANHLALALPDPNPSDFGSVVERFSSRSSVWWDSAAVHRFVTSLSQVQSARVEELRNRRKMTWRTAYRRTRGGVAVWEVRNDPVAGCLRTARGGSSKQAVVELGRGSIRVRWMTAREYGRLQGVDDSYDFAGQSPNKVMFGFGDAVCVPVVEWLAEEYLLPAVKALS